jgi:hypothetical protein
MVDEIVNAMVFCFSFFAYRRTHISAFVFLMFAALLGLALQAGAHIAAYSFEWFPLPFTAWFRIGNIVRACLLGISIQMK